MSICKLQSVCSVKIKNVLLELGVKNENEISSLAANLSSSEKEFLYLENKKSPTLPFCLNLFLGYGIGSFVQGDTTTGVTETFWEAF